MEAGESSSAWAIPWRSRISSADGVGKLVATGRGYEENVRATTLECNVAQPHPRQTRRTSGGIPRHRPRLDCAHGLLRYARPGTGPVFSSNTRYFTNDTMRLDFDPRLPPRCSRPRDIRGKPDGKRFTSTWWRWLGDRSRQGRNLREAGAPRMSDRVGILATPDMPTSLSASIPTTISTSRVHGQACDPNRLQDEPRFRTDWPWP